MAKDDLRRGNAYCPDRFDKFLILQREHLTAHNAGHSEPRDSAQSDEQHKYALAEESKQHYHQKEIRKRVEYVDETHHQFIDMASEVSRNRAVRYSYNETH